MIGISGPRFRWPLWMKTTRPVHLILLSVVLPAGGLAQAILQSDRTDALIGDQLELTLTIQAPGGMEWVNPGVIPGDTVASIDLIHTGDIEIIPDGHRLIYRKTWTVAVFDTGFVRVPPVMVILRSVLASDTLITNDIPLQIRGVTDDTGLAPIKPIIRERANLSDYLPYIFGVTGLLLLALAIFRLMRRKPRVHEVVEIRDVPPAHAIALGRLDALEAEKLWQQGQIKEYHARLHHIVREYLSLRYGVPALESTTGEVIANLHTLDLQPALLKKIREVLEAEDLIKFAKAQPPVDVHAQYLDFARRMILQTKEEPQNTDVNA